MVTQYRNPLVKRVLTLIAVVFFVVAMSARPVLAEPGDPTAPPDEGKANMTLGEVLETANRAWMDAQTVLDGSKKRQAELNEKVAANERELAPIEAVVNLIAAATYRTGGVRTAAALISSDGPESFMDRSLMINTIARYNDRQIAKLMRLRAELADAKKAIDAEVATQQAQTDVMGKKKQDAETALAKAGGRANGYISATSPLARPAPRNPDGSWPRESCIIDDPTTSGCVTARMLHASREARRAGFTRFYSCFRSSGPYEHPKGRACDFAAQVSGFGGVATGGDKIYGGNLAAFFVRNAYALGVLYVIWFKQIWTAASGWHYYGGGSGDPSSDHTNHVHVSVY